MDTMKTIAGIILLVPMCIAMLGIGIILLVIVIEYAELIESLDDDTED